MSNWNSDVMELLEKVRTNSVNLSEYHRKRALYFKSFSKYFDVPILVIGAFSSSFAVGAQPYFDQSLISLVGCFTGMCITIVTSIKLYLNIQDSMVLEIDMSKEFYTLAIEIYRIVSLDEANRGEDGVNYLNKSFSHYSKLVEGSNLLKKRFKIDQLAAADGTALAFGSDTDSDQGVETQQPHLSPV